MDFIGCFIFSIGVQSFSAPLDLPPGGITGFAIIVNHLTNIPVSILSLIINLPLLICAFFLLGKKIALSSVKTVVILTITLEVANQLIPKYSGDIMLASIFGGVLQGIGLGIIFLRGSTTGGTDIIAKLIQHKFPHVSTGRILFALDGIVLLITAFVYRSISNSMYALIIVFVCSKGKRQIGMNLQNTKIT